MQQHDSHWTNAPIYPPHDTEENEANQDEAAELQATLSEMKQQWQVNADPYCPTCDHEQIMNMLLHLSQTLEQMVKLVLNKPITNGETKRNKKKTKETTT